MNKLIFLSVFSALFCSIAYCNPLSLTEVLDSVEEQFPLILFSQAEIKKAEGDYLASQGSFDPFFKTIYSKGSIGYYQNFAIDTSIQQPTQTWGTTLSAGWKRSNGTFPVYNSSLLTFTEGELRAGIDIPLLKGGQTDERRTNIKKAEQGLSVATENFQAQKREIKKQASQRYWDWVAMGRKVRVTEELLEIALNRDKAIRERIKQGDSPEIDQADNQRAVLQRRSGLIAAQRAFQKASLDLALYFSNSQQTPVSDLSLSRLPKHYFYEELNQFIQDIEKKENRISNHPSLKQIEYQNNQLEMEYQLAKNQALPKLDIHFGISSDFGINPGTSYLPPTNYPVELKTTITLEMPVLFRTPRGKIISSQANLSKIETTQILTYNKLNLQLQDSIQNMKATYGKLILAKEEVKLAKKLENSERTRAFHGDSTLLIVNLREQITRDAMVKEIEAFSDFHKAKAEYEAINVP